MTLPSHSKMVDIIFDNTQTGVTLVVIENRTVIFVNYNQFSSISL
jgi:hypothetical protein